MKAVGALVLAAGASRRLGRPKQLLPFEGRSLLAAATAAFLGSGAARVVVVLGSEAALVREQAGLPEDARLRVVVNADWASGLASSLQRGLQEVEDLQAAVIGLGDQPALRAPDVQRVLEAWTPGTPLVVPVHGGRAVHPVLFARTLWPELRALSGDVGAREVVRRHWASAVRVDGAAPRDVDTEEEYRALLEGRPPGAGGLKVS